MADSPVVWDLIATLTNAVLNLYLQTQATNRNQVFDCRKTSTGRGAGLASWEIELLIAVLISMIHPDLEFLSLKGERYVRTCSEILQAASHNIRGKEQQGEIIDCIFEHINIYGPCEWTVECLISLFVAWKQHWSPSSLSQIIAMAEGTWGPFEDTARDRQVLLLRLISANLSRVKRKENEFKLLMDWIKKRQQNKSNSATIQKK
eukprot:Gregarina_sp_Poly_1__7491@NODE_417_length_8703_cov_212_060908_g339_i0_p4_GENE_NODE_417_length_8703_cov_212_060908_g339_i0NODE_417_length_8703_cov_212_060908_g339_i0_p4_ORF_typecomplete_len205_score17_31_NODE_417_length_8703_cov_212_060908_g339_i076268240